MGLTDPTDVVDEGHPRRWTVLWIMCLSLVLVVVSVSSLNVAIPAIQFSLAATRLRRLSSMTGCEAPSTASGKKRVSFIPSGSKMHLEQCVSRAVWVTASTRAPRTMKSRSP